MIAIPSALRVHNVLKGALFIVNQNLSVVAAGFINTAEDFHQRRFSCAIFAAEGVDFALLYRKRDVPQRINTWKIPC